MNPARPDPGSEQRMNSRILALLVLLGAASLALADYAVIIVNLHAKSPPSAENNIGGFPTPGGGGMTGVPPIGSPPIGGGMTGMRPPNNPMGLGFPGGMGATAGDAA